MKKFFNNNDHVKNNTKSPQIPGEEPFVEQRNACDDANRRSRELCAERDVEEAAGGRLLAGREVDVSKVGGRGKRDLGEKEHVWHLDRNY